MTTLSDLAVLVPAELPCADCDGTGQSEALSNVRRFFDPYEPIMQPCRSCKGEGVREVYICPLCQEEESICARICRRAVCCGKDPGECDCPDGVELYRQAYGLPKAA